MFGSRARPMLRHVALVLTVLVATAVTSPAMAGTTGKSTTKRTSSSLHTAVTTTVAPQPGTYTGPGMDPCAAPSVSDMQAWGASPYRAIGIYIAGNSRACQQPNLTAGWVDSVTSQGWHLLPIDAGYQAPCTAFSNLISSDAATAESQGSASADDAANNAASLGIPAGSTVYSDIEGYDRTIAGCSAAVLSFVSGWTAELHARGYLSGVYSSAGSGIADLAGQVSTGAYNLPDQIWFARWNGLADENTEPYAPNTTWANHQRIHQYDGGADETWGGVTINIDHDYVDVASSGGGGGYSKWWVDTSPDAPVYATPNSTTQTGTLYAGTNYVYCKVWGRMIGTSTVYNHWWLRTDPDVGPANQYVSAYYLSRWGNDQALDNNGNDIPNC